MKPDTIFAPADTLEQCIHAGDFDGVIAALRTMSHGERKARHARMRDIRERTHAAGWEKDGRIKAWWGGEPSAAQLEAARAALFFCGDREARVAQWSWAVRLYPHLGMLEPAVLRGFGTELVAAWPRFMATAQQLFVDGLADRPESDEFIIGLIGAVRDGCGEENPLLSMIAADPTLLEGPVMRIFEVEGSAESNMASVEKYSTGTRTWNHALLELVRTGKLTRARLIERCLYTLEKDWPQFRAGWFSRFHDQLAPSLDEMVPLSARYLGLCNSRIPPTVTLALNALAALLKGGRVDSAALLDALIPVMSSAVKGHVDAALKLLDQLVKLDCALAQRASALAARALSHEAPDLHKKIIARLAAWGFDQATYGELEMMLPYISALHRSALETLLGVAPAPAGEAIATATHAAAGLMPARDPSRKLTPLNDIDALVQTIAFVLENEHEIDDFERALDAVVRLGPRLKSESERFSPVSKRVKKLRRGDHAIGAALADALDAAFDGSIRRADHVANSSDADLGRRIADLTQFMAQQTGLAALSTPTHKRGFIDPLALAERIAAHAEAGAVSTLGEQVRAILRLVPGPATDAVRALAALGQTPLVQACRHALGDQVDMSGESALFLAAARIRHPGGDDPRALQAFGDTGPDGALAARFEWSARKWHDELDSYMIELTVPDMRCLPDQRFIAMRRHSARHALGSGYFSWGEGNLLYAASILPGSLETFFSYGALEMGQNIDWSEANWHHKAYLALLIDPTVPVTPPALKLMALALAAKEPGQLAMAVDAFVAGVLEQRFDVPALAGEIRWILLSKIGKGARYAKSLASAARADPAMPAAVIKALCTMLDIGEAAAPKDTGALLELLIELSVGNTLELPAGARARIARLKLTGKGKAAQKELLARFT